MVRPFCPSCGFIFEQMPQKGGECPKCLGHFLIQDGRLLSEADWKAEQLNQELKARASCPPPEECPTCAGNKWQFVSLSPNGKAATWKCIAYEHCPKRVLVRSRSGPPDAAASRAIPKAVQREVWRRDQGRCVNVLGNGQICGSREKLCFDHIIPFSKGGSNTVRNIQLLCERCNLQKQARIGG